MGAGGANLQETTALYLELKPGEKPDFEVVGLAAAAFAEAVKEIDYILDPGLEVRLEFESGTESSLILNAVLKVLKSRMDTAAPFLGIVVGTQFALSADVRQWAAPSYSTTIFRKEKRLELSDHDVKRIARHAKTSQAARSQVRRRRKTRKARSYRTGSR